MLDNMNLAEKTGVFHVIKDMQIDAKEKNNWINRRKALKMQEVGGDDLGEDLELPDD